MLKGLSITPPILGRISIGKVVEKNGKRLPEKDDQFTITSQVQNKDGWLPHPVDEDFRKAQGGKLRSIPIRLLFNDPDLNFRAEYSLFDRDTGRPLCVGNGEMAKRVGAQGMEEVSCPGPQRSPYGQQQGCKLYGRLNLFVEGQGDELGSFIFRTTGYNSVRTLAARLKYFEAVSGGLTRYLPLTLRLRAKSTTQSYRTPIYYVDLTLRDELTLTEAVGQARQEAMLDDEAGLTIREMETVARALLRNGQFEEVDEEVPMLLEEFYPEASTDETNGNASAEATTSHSTPQGQATRTPQRPQPRRSPLTNKLGKGNPSPPQ